jgi:hypothetical protein
MKPVNSKILPPPPGLISSILAGFDAITKHVYLIFFPVVLDALLWLGPHLRIYRLIQELEDHLMRLSLLNSPETAQMLQSNLEMWKYFGERINLMAFLRTYPVGIPSLMAANLPIEAPSNLKPLMVEVTSVPGVICLVLSLILVGMVFGGLYFNAVSGAAVSDRVLWSTLIKSWPWTIWQTVLLLIFWIIVLMIVSVPSFCMISVLSLGSLSIARLGLLLYIGILIWVIFPLVLSGHGIYVYRLSTWMSIIRGVQITRLTLPTTGMLFLVIFVISEGLDILWQLPEARSWMSLIGIVGHGFVTTGLLAGSFVYYQQADRWVQSLRQVAQVPPAQINA